MTSLRTTIATAFVDMGVAVEADAVAELMDFIESQNDDLETLTRIRDAVEAGDKLAHSGLSSSSELRRIGKLLAWQMVLWHPTS